MSALSPTLLLLLLGGGSENCPHAPAVAGEVAARTIGAAEINARAPAFPALPERLMVEEHAGYWSVFQGTDIGPDLRSSGARSPGPVIVQTGMSLDIDKCSGAVSNVTRLAGAPRHAPPNP